MGPATVVNTWCLNRSLGLAASLKCTPLLFLVYFAYRRQWRVVLATAAAVVVLTLSPIFVLGARQYGQAMSHWFKVATAIMSEPDPSRTVVGEDKVENLALRPALARYLMRLPQGHAGRPETSYDDDRPDGKPNPAYLHFADLSPPQAGIVVKLVTATLVLTCAWLIRRPVEDRADPVLLWQCAAISVLILLLSPFTWDQHCAGVVPGLYLICRARFSGWRVPRSVTVLVAMYAVLCLFTARMFVGKQLSKLLDSYHLETMGLLLLLAAVFVCAREVTNRRPQSQ